LRFPLLPVAIVSLLLGACAREADSQRLSNIEGDDQAACMTTLRQYDAQDDKQAYKTCVQNRITYRQIAAQQAAQPLNGAEHSLWSSR
jgi:outer membrane PBP1 activator LpoA protein